MPSVGWYSSPVSSTDHPRRQKLRSGRRRSKKVSTEPPSWSLSRETGACTSTRRRPSFDPRSQRFGKHTDPPPTTSPSARSTSTTRSSCTSRPAVSSGCRASAEVRPSRISRPSSTNVSPVRWFVIAPSVTREPLRPPIREMLHQRAEDLGGLFLDALNERQDGAGMPGEDVALGRHVALVGRSDLDPIGEIEGPQTEPPPEGPALVGLVIGFDERHSTIVGAQIARHGPDVSSVRSARYRRYVRRFPLTVVAIALTSGVAVAATLAQAANGPIMSAAAPRRAGGAAADPEPGHDPRPAAGEAARRSDQRPAGRQRSRPVPVRRWRSPPSPPPIRLIRPPVGRCRTPAPTERTPASASPARV